jgi:hypothetical protein
MDSYAGAVFVCNNHLMTSLNASDYGVIYLTPPALLDWTAGEAVLRFDVSTLRSSTRDWWDVWVTPYGANQALPLEDWLPDLQGEPRQALMFKMEGRGTVQRIENHAASEITSHWTYNLDHYLQPSATVRQTFEIRISRTHVKMWLPALGLVWMDADLAQPLDWSQGIVQIGHHSYTPTKDNAGHPGTWHWDNVSLNPAQPFQIIRAAERAGSAFTFRDPAPADSYLRFAGFGALEISLDGGQTWVAAQRQAQQKDGGYNASSYWHPVPAGTTAFQVRGTESAPSSGPWHVQDVAIFSRAPKTTPTPTATRTPTATATLLPTVTSTPTQVAPTSTPTATILECSKVVTVPLTAERVQVICTP